jgi:hypothetical protein
MITESLNSTEIHKDSANVDLVILASSISQYSYQRILNPKDNTSKISTQTDQLSNVIEQEGHDEGHALAHSILQDILAKPDNTLVSAMQRLGFDMANPAGFDVSGERAAIVVQYIVTYTNIIKYDTPEGKRTKIIIDTQNIPSSDNLHSLARLSAKDSIGNLDLMKYQFSEEYFADTYQSMLEPEMLKKFFETKNLKAHDLHSTFYRDCFYNLKGLDTLSKNWDPIKPEQQLAAIRDYFGNQNITFKQMSEFYSEAFTTEISKLLDSTAGLNEIAQNFNPMENYVRNTDSENICLLEDIQKVQMGIEPSSLLEIYNREFEKVTGLSITQFSDGIKVVADAALIEYLSQIPEEYISREGGNIIIDYDDNQYSQGTKIENDVLISQSVASSRKNQMPWEMVSTNLDNDETLRFRKELDGIIGPQKIEYLELSAQLKILQLNYNKNWKEIDIIHIKLRNIKREIKKLTTSSPGKEIVEQMRFYEYGYSDLKDKPKNL